MSGMELHQRLSADMWCVSKKNLRDFRDRVRQAIDNGTIQPTARDGFVAADDEIGPRIHTVVQQLIKPVTHEAGDMSWALMLNPDGLRCDLFVTHAWQEGVFEFIDKVLHSWPRGAGGAYCCMLSNPQNLDIGALISNPRDSPFALALTTAHFMMVVPNSKVSIYSRIWCAYEAFLAYEQSKTIFTASRAQTGVWVGFVAVLLIFVLLATIVAVPVSFVVGRPDKDFDFDEAYIYELAGLPRSTRTVLLVLMVSSIFFCFRAQAAKPYSKGQRAWMFAGILCESIFIGVQSCMVAHTYEGAFDSSFRALYFRVQCLVLLTGVLTFMIAIAAIEIDNKWSVGRANENSQLLNGYSGRLNDAEASRKEDADRIFGELEASGNGDAANGAVHVLCLNGMSTRRLRQTVAQVGELKQAGYWNLSYLTIGLGGMWLYMACRALAIKLAFAATYAMHRHGAADGVEGTCECHIRGKACMTDGGCVLDTGTCSASSECAPIFEHPIVWCNIFTLLCGFAWIPIFFRSRPDIRRFRTISMTRIMMITYGVGFLVDFFTVPSLQESDITAVIRLFSVFFLYGVMVAGPVRLGKVPCLGPPLVRFFYANSTSCRKRKAQKKEEEKAEVVGAQAEGATPESPAISM